MIFVRKLRNLRSKQDNIQVGIKYVSYDQNQIYEIGVFSWFCD